MRAARNVLAVLSVSVAEVDQVVRPGRQLRRHRGHRDGAGLVAGGEDRGAAEREEGDLLPLRTGDRTEAGQDPLVGGGRRDQRSDGGHVDSGEGARPRLGGRVLGDVDGDGAERRDDRDAVEPFAVDERDRETSRDQRHYDVVRHLEPLVHDPAFWSGRWNWALLLNLTLHLGPDGCGVSLDRGRYRSGCAGSTKIVVGTAADGAILDVGREFRQGGGAETGTLHHAGSLELIECSGGQPTLSACFDREVLHSSTRAGAGQKHLILHGFRCNRGERAWLVHDFLDLLAHPRVADPGGVGLTRGPGSVCAVPGVVLLADVEQAGNDSGVCPELPLGPLSVDTVVLGFDPEDRTVTDQAPEASAAGMVGATGRNDDWCLLSDGKTARQEDLAQRAAQRVGATSTIHAHLETGAVSGLGACGVMSDHTGRIERTGAGGGPAGNRVHLQSVTLERLDDSELVGHQSSSPARSTLTASSGAACSRIRLCFGSQSSSSCSSASWSNGG